jgi:hypothetical protein
VKKNMRWTTYDQITEVGDEINSLGVHIGKQRRME